MSETPKQSVGAGDNCSKDIEDGHPRSLPKAGLEGEQRKQTGCQAKPFGIDLPDEDVFKKAPREDCGICCLELPNIAFDKMRNYQPCCGKFFCAGCMHEILIKGGNHKCPFCRANMMDDLFIERLEKRAALGDCTAIYNLGIEYYKGRCIKKNLNRSLKLFHQAADLGSVSAHGFLTNATYRKELGIEVSGAKADYHLLMSAMGGHNICRHNVASTDLSNGHIDRAIKHYLIAAGDGFEPSLKALQKAYRLGIAHKEDYAKALHAYQAYVGATRSTQREESLRFCDFIMPITDAIGMKKYNS